MTINNTITLTFDPTDRVYAQKLTAKQLDNLTRALTVKLTQGGSAFLPPEGATVKLRGTKPDSTVFDIIGIRDESDPKGQYSFIFTESMLSASGMIRCDVVCYWTEGDTIPLCSTEVFYIDNIAASVNPNGKRLQTELQTLEKAVEAANIAAENLNETAQALLEAKENGDFNGEKGDKGDTPVRGTDYWTEEDKAQIESDNVAFITDELAKRDQLYPEFANSTEDCTDQTKLYVLPDGYIYAYMEKTETVKPNMYDAETAKLNYRVNSSGAETVYSGRMVINDYIAVELTEPYKVTVTGCPLEMVYETYLTVNYYDEDKNHLGQLTNAKVNDFLLTADGCSFDLYYASYSAAKYVKISLGIHSDLTAVTESDVADLFVSFEPLNGTVTSLDWHNTDHAFVPADYEDRIIELESVAAENKSETEKIKEQLEYLENSGSIYGYPEVWDNAVEECISKIKNLQKGKDCVTFPFFSDNHQRLGYAGALIAKVMKECNIPYAFYCGDSVSSGFIESEAEMIKQDKAFDEMMKAIPQHRFCRAVGNHDGFWAVSATEKYRYSWEKIYELFMRQQSIYPDRHFGGDGSYFYVDDNNAKIRFVVLNSQWSAYAEKPNGTVDDRNGAGFGQAQFDWLIDDALKFENDGWALVFISHSPVTDNFHSLLRDAAVMQGVISAFVAKSSFGYAYVSGIDSRNNVDVFVDFGEYCQADVIGWFSGHIHRDRIYQRSHTDDPDADDQNTASLPWKTVTITSDANLSYDDAEDERIMNGDTSHAIDFVTVNRSDRTVNLTRLGIGADRSFSY